MSADLNKTDRETISAARAGIDERRAAREQRITELERLLAGANEIIRSFSAVCDRNGEQTNWEGLKIQVRRVLAEQHRFMHPEQYVSGPRAG